MRHSTAPLRDAARIQPALVKRSATRAAKGGREGGRVAPRAHRLRPVEPGAAQDVGSEPGAGRQSPAQRSDSSGQRPAPLHRIAAQRPPLPAPSAAHAQRRPFRPARAAAAATPTGRAGGRREPLGPDLVAAPKAIARRRAGRRSRAVLCFTRSTARRTRGKAPSPGLQGEGRDGRPPAGRFLPPSSRCRSFVPMRLAGAVATR